MQKSDQLVENLDNLVKENFVLDATIYDYNGKELAQYQYRVIFVSNLVLSIKMKVFSTQQIVEPISWLNNVVRGFLRVTFDAQYVKRRRAKSIKFFTARREIVGLFIRCLFAVLHHYF